MQTLTCCLFLCPGAVLEQWSKGITIYLCQREQGPFPHKGPAQFCEAIYPIFCYALTNWLDCKEEEVRSAAFHPGAAAGMFTLVCLSVPRGCEQRDEGNGLPGEKQLSPVALLQGGLGCQRGEMLSVLRSEGLSCREEGKGNPLPVGRPDWCPGDAEC